MNDDTQSRSGPEAEHPCATSSLIRSPFVDESGNPRTAAMKAALAEFWIGLKRLPAYLKLSASMAKDDRIPKTSKGMLVVGGAYAISPIDLVPGIIPVAGQLDDLYVILTAIQQSIRMAPDDVADEHLARHGVTRDDIEHDLAAVRNLVKEAALITAQFGLRALKNTGNRIRRFADQYTQRGASKHDNQPI